MADRCISLIKKELLIENISKRVVNGVFGSSKNTSEG